MLNLPTATSELLVVTGSGVNEIAVHASFNDIGILTQVVVPGATDTIITTAMTTVAVASPPAGFDRNIKFLTVTNTSGSPCAISIQQTDGVTPIPLFSIILLPGYSIQYSTDADGFVVLNPFGRALVDPGVPTAISAGATLGSSGTIVFSNLNGVTFGMVGNTITATVTPGAAAGIAAIEAGTQTATSGTVAFVNSNGITFGMSGSSQVTASVASSLTAINLSAGTTSNLASAFTFADSNRISFGLNASTLTASYAFNVSAGTTSNNLAALTFGNANAVSFGLNASTLTASFGGQTISVFSQDADFVTNFTASQAMLSFQKVSLPMNLRATQFVMLADFRGNVASSDAVTVNHAVYTLSAGTASLASFGSRTISWAGAAYSNVSGTRYRSVGVSYSMTPGDYLFAWAVSTANGVVVRPFGRMAANIVGAFDGVEVAAFLNGSSISSVNTFPASVAVTDTGYARTGFSALLQPGIILLGT